MICVVQRVLQAKVIVAGQTVGAIQQGLAVLASIERDDTIDQVKWTAAKLAGLRVFRSTDRQKHFDQDVTQVGGAMLLISNFTVAADTRKGRRPSLDRAADPVVGQSLFAQFVQATQSLGITVATGQFGADMQIHLVNDGPATFIVKTE